MYRHVRAEQANSHGRAICHLDKAYKLYERMKPQLALSGMKAREREGGGEV